MGLSPLLEAVTIRQASLADVPRLLPLVQAFIQVAPLFVPLDAEAVATLLTTACAASGSCVLIAEEEDVMQGFAVAHSGPYALNPAVVLVQEQAFYVCPAAEHRGMGRALLTALEAWAREQGAVCLLMSCFAGAARVHALYTTAGYRLFEHHFVKEVD
jgi:GNAT superfamily N-acetyltransferase